jgi:hypothetical protein
MMTWWLHPGNVSVRQTTPFEPLANLLSHLGDMFIVIGLLSYADEQHIVVEAAAQPFDGIGCDKRSDHIGLTIRNTRRIMQITYHPQFAPSAITQLHRK